MDKERPREIEHTQNVLTEKDKEILRVAFQALYAELIDRKKREALPESLIFVDTLARPLAALMKPILQDIYGGELPERRFLAPTRSSEMGTSEQWMRPEEWKNIIFQALAKDPANAIDLGEEVLRVKWSRELDSLERFRQSKSDEPETQTWCAKAKTNILEKQERELSGFRQSAETIFLPEFEKLVEHFHTVIQDKTEVLIIDDYTWKGQTMRTFAALARQFPNTNFSFFSAIVDKGVFEMQGGSDYPENFQFLRGVEWGNALFLPDYSRTFWDDKEKKEMATGVKKSSDKPVSTVSEKRVPALIRKLRDEMRDIGLGVVKDQES